MLYLRFSLHDLPRHGSTKLRDSYPVRRFDWPGLCPTYCDVHANLLISGAIKAGCMLWRSTCSEPPGLCPQTFLPCVGVCEEVAKSISLSHVASTSFPFSISLPIFYARSESISASVLALSCARNACDLARITRIWLASWLAQVVGGTSGPDVGDPTKTLRGNASKQNRGEGEGGRRGGASAPTLRGHYGSSARRRVFFRTPSRSLQRGGSCSGPACMDLFAPGAATAQ